MDKYINREKILNRTIGSRIYPPSFAHLLFDGCSFLLWSGDGSYSCTTLALYQVRPNLFLVYQDFQGSCSGCGNTIEEFGIENYLKVELPQKVKQFDTLETATDHLLSELGLLSYGDEASLEINLLNLQINPHDYGGEAYDDDNIPSEELDEIKNHLANLHST